MQRTDFKVDTVVIGSGPAGMAAAVAAAEEGAGVCVIEREERPGGILKQCIHDGFGLLQFQEKLTGPEYSYRYLQMVENLQIPVLTKTFLLEIQHKENGFRLILQNESGVFSLNPRAVIYAAGCREKTSRQVFLQGTRPAGVITAGTLQYMINIQGYLPAGKCVILGSGDIGLIMARRLTLEGAEVEGVYEIKSEPSGLTRNVAQCLEDYRIPLHLSHTVTEIHGTERLTGVTVARVDENFKPLSGTEKFVPVDTLVLSVGLIPENDIIESLGVELDSRTSGPVVDQYNMTSLEGLFVCGNALHVNDLVDYVSESGETAGRAAAEYAARGLNHGDSNGKRVNLTPGNGIMYVVPQQWKIPMEEETVFYFRSRETVFRAELEVAAGNQVICREKYPVLRPPEMERLVIEPYLIPPGTKEIQFRLRC